MISVQLKGNKMKVNEASLENVRLLSANEIKEIHRVVTSNRAISFSWGARSWTNVKNRGLAFRVSGFKHKGNVVVMLNHNDFFNVELVTIRGNSKQLVKDIYVGDLVDVIDGLVEKTDNYEETVKESFSL